MLRKKTSKDLLADSLIDLLEQTSFDKISVNQIVENCGVAKRTFYNHFRDKYDLALWIYTRQLEEYCDISDPGLNFTTFLNATAEVTWKDQNIIRNLLKYQGQNNFRRSVGRPLRDFYLRIMTERFGDTVSPELEAILTFYVFGMIAYVEDALEASVTPHYSEIASLFASCAPEALIKYFE